jgi:type I restriction enzyme, S subunit
MSDPQEQLIALEQVAAPGPNSFVDGPFGSDMKSSEYSERGVRLVQLQNIGDGYWIDDNRKFIPLEKFESLKRHGAVPGDIVIAKMADPVARSCILPAVTDQFIVVADCIKLTPDPERFDARFVSAAINSHKTRSEAERKSSGTTRLRINLSALKTVHIWAPQPSEQRKIAHILDTVDEAIAKTEAVIAKLKQVRAGLLHDLLTRGIDENGQLRDPIAHPEQFQESSLGQIPREWHISTLGMELPLQRGFDITVAEQQQGEVPVVSSSGITSYHNKAMVACPGVVTGRKGKLGDVYYIDRPFWPHDTTLWVTDFHGNSEKFAALLLSQMRLERFDAATSVPTLNRNFIHPLPIALPSRPEQERLVAVVEAWDECLDRESKWLDKLRDLKTGISTDLLTGRVRVPEEIAVAL